MTEFIELHGAGAGISAIINISYINMVYPREAIINQEGLEEATRTVLLLNDGRQSFECQESFETVKELLKKSILNPPIIVGDKSASF